MDGTGQWHLSETMTPTGGQGIYLGGHRGVLSVKHSSSFIQSPDIHVESVG